EPAHTTAAELLARRDTGDTAAARILRDWTQPLRAAIDSLSATLNPETAVLGGGLGAEASAALSAHPEQSGWFTYKVAPASLGDDAGVIGAALAALSPTARSRKRLVMVNGVPASGKSHVATVLAQATGWPLLSLDTIKNPFLE